MAPSPSLRLSRRPQTLGVVLPMLVVALATSAGYYVTTPPPLAVQETPVTATVPSGQPVYLGVYTLDEDAGRSLDVRGVQVDVTSTREIAVQPLVCVGGDVDVTTAPDGSCRDIVDPAGTDLGPEDELMLQVTGSGATVALIDPVRITFTEGVRRGARQAGAPVRVRVLPPGTPR
ncbi:hypothetical protein [Nocardioides sp. AX2bis]|uniref:hypothetical protein n=1 Tax=Nocardioides sp. AX2bis TaxID=2653157 RepID=UPI0012F3D6C6|nr:hypothetical protein [Nocardioides sp. AX2bis]VXB31017.1 conserved hypothetical protein [Nocardioides sp. AX2bis]